MILADCGSLTYRLVIEFCTELETTKFLAIFGKIQAVTCSYSLLSAARESTEKYRNPFQEEKSVF
jgi:hypothetical protein